LRRNQVRNVEGFVSARLERIGGANNRGIARRNFLAPCRQVGHVEGDIGWWFDDDLRASRLARAVVGDLHGEDARRASGARNWGHGNAEINFVGQHGNGNWRDIVARIAVFDLIGSHAGFAVDRPERSPSDDGCVHTKYQRATGWNVREGAQQLSWGDLFAVGWL
jgi:hypothetical protein